MMVLAALFGLFAHSAFANEPLRLNAASVEQLAALPEVGDATARQIVALREQRGQLGSVEALRILALPETTLDALRQGTVIDLAITAKNGKTYNSVAEVMQEFRGEPDINTVHAMTLAYTRSNPELVDAWMRASRTTNLLPKLGLQYEKKLTLNTGYDYVADPDSGDLVDEKSDADTDNDDKYVVKMEWRLDKLIMSSERIRVINEAQDIVKLRDKVLDEVTRLYFDRRRLEIDLLLNPPADLKKLIDDELRLQELTANIDALTGGAFSAALPSGRDR